MKKQIFLILALFIFLIGKVNALPVPGNETTTNTATTIVLSNEEGKLIDQLIAAGYGEASLYETLVALQNTSGGVISNKFLEVLRACPAGSPIFTKKLKDYAGISGGIAINTDGTVFATSIKGRSYYGQTGYSTYPPEQSGVGRELFTYANSPEYYINAENGGKTYKVFAVGWSFGEAPQPTTFVLSNEEGRMIDQLIAAGHGNISLYRTLILLQESSGGVISDEFLDVLGACPGSSPIFTQKLRDYAGISGGVAINTDGTVFITNIKGRSYHGKTGYSTYPPNQSGQGRELFTYADSTEYYINAESGGKTYKVFAIAWSSGEAPQPTTFVLSNEEGRMIDQLIAAGYGNVSLYRTLAAIQESSGGVISDEFMEALGACPAGSPIFTQKLRDYAGISGGVAINTDGTVFTTSIKGRSYYGQTGYSTYPPEQSGVGRELFTYANSPEYYINAENGGKTYKVFAVGWSFGEAPQPTTFVLSNEEGRMIDQLIAAGYGNVSLYETLAELQESSGGVISDEFLDILGACPKDSPIFTHKLNEYAGISNGIAINTDGRVFTTSIKGRNYFGQTGYSTHPPNQFGMGRELFTYANSPAYYIGAKSGNTTYKVFAIGWSSNQFPTFMLSNEEGGLIDKLIADGHGDESLYEVLQILQPISGGAIPADYMAALAACPADCEAKTAKLSNFSSKFNNPIGIGADGKLIVAQIHGRDYYGDAGFSTTTGNIAGVGTVLFTSADSESDYVDAGTLVSGGVTYFYKAFAIGWMPADAITVSGTATDDTAILQIDNKTPSARDKTWDINVTTGTVKAGVSASDVTLTGLPAGLNYTAAKGTGNNIVITLTGVATTALTGDATITAVIKGSAVTETGARDSEGIALKLWYVGEGTTIVLSNESGGYLIDKLIAAGHGDDSLYEVLELLQPNFSSVITERFMKTLDSTPAGGEVFTVALSNFAGLNNPVCVNADGTLSIQAIFGRDYNGDTGYTTTQSNLTGIGAVSLTTADDAAHLIQAGVMEVSAEGTRYYKAFAILWMPADAITVAGTATDDTAILQIDNKTPSARDKTWDINVTAGTVKAGVSASDVTLTGLPAGLNYTAAKGAGNNIVITLTGVATTALTGDATITAVIKGSAVTESGARDSEGISLKLWYVGAGTTIVLTNEAAKLIDKLIAAGHGNDNLYKALELLQPYFSGVITNRFMKTLDSTPVDGEVFTATLSSFAGVNNPVGINTDGTLRIYSIYGKSYYGKTGYTTTESNMTGVGTVWATAADSPAYYINAGTATVGDNTITYKAFAVVWMPDLTPVGDLTKNDHIIVYPNPTKGMVWFDLQVNDPIIKVEVYDIKGKQLFCTDHVKENHIDLSGLKNGIYLLKLETHNQKLNQKVIKK